MVPELIHLVIVHHHTRFAEQQVLEARRVSNTGKIQQIPAQQGGTSARVTAFIIDWMAEGKHQNKDLRCSEGGRTPVITVCWKGHMFFLLPPFCSQLENVSSIKETMSC